MQPVSGSQIDWLAPCEHAPADVLRVWQPGQWPVAPDWQGLVDQFLQSPAGVRLADFVQTRLAAGARVFPSSPFHALALTPLSQVRVVILGQDPYHGAGQAQGLAFSVAPGVRLPPSLRNVLQEVARDPDLSVAARMRLCSRLSQPDGSLVPWAQQGVLLLNTSLTVEEARPGSHTRVGWEVLTDAIVQTVSAAPRPVVFMLWGGHAQSKANLIKQGDSDGRHLVLAANHPSPLSARRGPLPFVGCSHFVRANAHLSACGESAIDWA